ncbi:MAG: response regulator [Acidimicrobiales bacterium]
MIDATGPRRVLIVDDEEDARLVAQLGIALVTDWEARLAASGDEALACFREWQPEAVLLDTSMPDCDAFATLEAMRDAAADGHVPFVLVADPETPAEALDAHGWSVEGVLHKPLDLLSVGAQLAALLGWPQSN